MKKIFVSVPMHGRKLDDINSDIRKAADTFIKWNEDNAYYTDDVEFVDTLAQYGSEQPVKNERIWYLGKALETLSDCDAIIFCPRYSDASGCIVEKIVANRYGLDSFIIGQCGNILNCQII